MPLKEAPDQNTSKVAEPQPQTPIVEDDPFEIPAKPAESKKAQEEAPPQEPVEDRPRDDSGRFLPVKKTHSRRMTAMALSLGIPQEEIDSLPTEQLEDLVFHLNEQRFRLEAPRPKAPPQEEAEEPIDLGIPAEDEEKYDPALLKALKKLAEENRAAKKELRQIKEREKTREQRQVDEAIDDAFSGLSEAQKAMFGSGSLGTLTPEELARRNAVLAVAQADKHGSIKQKIQRAVNVLYPTAQAPAQAAARPSNGTPYIEEQLAKRRDQWEKAPTARPISREGGMEAPSVKKAKHTFKQAVAELAESGEDTNDDFPG